MNLKALQLKASPFKVGMMEKLLNGSIETASF